MTDATDDIGARATEALDLLTAAVEEIPPDGWGRASNLDGWSVRDLVGHATGSAAKIVTLVEGGEPWGRSVPSDWVRDDPAAFLRELAVRLRTALPGADMSAPRVSPEGTAQLRRALTFPVSDLTLHSWDVRRSLGRPAELPPGLLAFCDELVASLPEELLRRPGGFGPARHAPDDATPTARLMAHLGRTP